MWRVSFYISQEWFCNFLCKAPQTVCTVHFGGSNQLQLVWLGNHRMKRRKESCILKIPYFQMKSHLFFFLIWIFSTLAEITRGTFPLRVVSLKRFVFSVSRYSDTVSVYICATPSFILTVQYSDYRLCHCGEIGGGNK